MKRFSDIPSVVHAFAHQTYPECSTYNGNVYYHDKVIFSYGRHFPMGRLMGDNIVLLTNRSYSQSTSNHKNKLRQAVNHMDRHYCEDPENPLGWESIDRTLDTIKGYLESAAKRRSPDLRAADINHANAAYGQIEWIREWEKKNKKSVEQFRGWWKWQSLKPEWKARWKSMGKTLGLAATDATAALANISKAQLAADKKRRAAIAKANKASTEQAQVALAEWQYSGNRIAGFHGIKQFLGHDGLRFVRRTSSDKSPDDMVGTTQGLYVPAEDCRKAWPLIKAAYARLDAGEMQVTFSDKVRASARLGNFAPNGIRSDGCLLVGCHCFTRKSVENLAKALGVN